MRWSKEYRKYYKSIIKKEYTTQYFKNTKQLLDFSNNESISLLQIKSLNNNDILVSGINEVASLIKWYVKKNKIKNLEVYSVQEKTITNSKKPIMKIVCRYKDICLMENIIIGILTSRTNISTNAWNCKKELLDHQEIIYMLDRANFFINQKFDAYAAYNAGIKKFVTEEQVKLIKKFNDVEVVGTIPHSAIQQYKNDLNKLIKDYYTLFNKKIIVLIDFDNDVISTLEKIKSNLNLVYGVRIDTSKSLVDKSLKYSQENFGINNNLIKLVKKWLVENGFKDIKIVVSSSINPKKIKEINSDNNYVDIFGIGSYFLENNVNITADLVKIDNIRINKFSREELQSDNLIKLI